MWCQLSQLVPSDITLLFNFVCISASPSSGTWGPHQAKSFRREREREKHVWGGHEVLGFPPPRLEHKWWNEGFHQHKGVRLFTARGGWWEEGPKFVAKPWVSPHGWTELKILTVFKQENYKMETTCNVRLGGHFNHSHFKNSEKFLLQANTTSLSPPLSPLNLFHLTTIFTFYQRLEELLSDLENKAVYSEFFHLPCRKVPPKSQNRRESPSIPVQHY